MRIIKLQIYHGGYIYDDGFVNLTLDPEIPIKGLVILGTKRTTSSFCDFSDDEQKKILDVTTHLLNTFHQIGLKKIIQFQDEGSNGQFHIWFLPRHDWTYQFGNNLDDIVNYSKNVLNTSDEYRHSLLNCMSKIKSNFKI